MNDLLTAEEKKSIEKDNAKKHWGFPREEILGYIEQHRTGDAKTKQAIEYRLEDVNYSDILRHLEAGDYAGAIAVVDKFWQKEG